MSNTMFNYTLDEFYETQSIGSINKAIGKNLYGFNHRQIPTALPINKDSYGFTFFTRPQLNMRSVNIRNVRKFYDLLNTDELSMQRYVRCTLDPRLETGIGDRQDDNGPVTSPLVDNNQAFIPLLTNSLVSLNGWQDFDVQTYTSKEGVYREQYTQVDSINEFYNTFQITASFNNTKGDPILYLFYIWIKYMTYVYEGRLSPYPDFIKGNLLDYCTRIYRVVLDQTKRYVTKIVSCGIAFPVSAPLGQSFDFKLGQPYNDQTKEITIRFQCLGCEYYDPIVLLEFNRVVEMFNPAMKCGYFGEESPDESQLVKVPRNVATLFNYSGYPRINLETHELEWWVPREVFERTSRMFLSPVGEGSYYADYRKMIGSDLIQTEYTVEETNGDADEEA